MAKDGKIIIQVTGMESLAPSSKSKNPLKEYEDIGNYLGKEMKTYKESLLSKWNAEDNAMINALSSVFENQKQIVETAVSSGWSRYTSLQEDYISENKINNIKTSVNNVKSISSSVISGVSTGAQIGTVVGGPVGAAVGAAVGVAMGAMVGGIKNEYKNRKKLQSYYKQLNETNFKTYLDSSRAGLIDNGRGTEN